MVAAGMAELQAVVAATVAAVGELKARAELSDELLASLHARLAGCATLVDMEARYSVHVADSTAAAIAESCWIRWCAPRPPPPPTPRLPPS